MILGRLHASDVLRGAPVIVVVVVFIFLHRVEGYHSVRRLLLLV